MKIFMNNLFIKFWIRFFYSLFLRFKRLEGNLLILGFSILLFTSDSFSFFLLILTSGIIVLSFSYFINDVFDVDIDLKSPIKKEKFHSIEIKKYKKEFNIIAFGLFIFLALVFYTFHILLFLAFLLHFITNIAYSFKFKRMVFLDLIFIWLWAFSYLLLFSFYNISELLHFCILGGFFTIISHIFQSGRDLEYDKKENVFTTAVVLGENTFKLLYFSLFFSSFYIIIFFKNLLSSFIVFLFLILLIMYKKDNIVKLWKISKVFLGLAWIILLLG